MQTYLPVKGMDAFVLKMEMPKRFTYIARKISVLNRQSKTKTTTPETINNLQRVEEGQRDEV